MLRLVVRRCDKVLLLSQMAAAPFAPPPRSMSQSPDVATGKAASKIEAHGFSIRCGPHNGSQVVRSVQPRGRRAHPSTARLALYLGFSSPQQQTGYAPQSARASGAPLGLALRVANDDVGTPRWTAARRERRTPSDCPVRPREWAPASPERAAGRSGRARRGSRCSPRAAEGPIRLAPRAGPAGTAGTSLPCFGQLSTTVGCKHVTAGCGSHVPGPIPALSFRVNSVLFQVSNNHTVAVRQRLGCNG
jgi:hypothetical protein